MYQYITWKLEQWFAGYSADRRYVFVPIESFYLASASPSSEQWFFYTLQELRGKAHQATRSTSASAHL